MLDGEAFWPLQNDLSLEQLQAALRACGALLRGHKHTIGSTGKHIRRQVVETILAWAQADEATLQANGQRENARVGVLLDQAGMGKTTVSRDVVVELEQAGIAVLAIKADQQLSGVKAPGEVPGALGLPDSIESIVGRLAQEGPVVVVIDQIDALSLALSHDQRALDVTLATVARLKEIPNVRVLISCRTFDLHSNPHLRQYASCRHFALPLLDEGDARPFVEECGQRWSDLSPATQELLRVPLHLDLFVMALEKRVATSTGGNTVADAGYGVTTLQDLYRLLWDNVIRREDAGAPAVAEREAVIERLAGRMAATHKTSAPKSFFSQPDNAHLEAAVQWLASVGILVDSGQEWVFLHQTFVDYCAAKAFVESAGDLAATILSGDQGLFARPQLLQTLAHLRGSHAHRGEYLQQLQVLLSSPEMHEHLRVLLFGWFGGLRNPDDNEWRLASRVLRRPDQQAQLLGWMSGNPAWFARIHGALLPGWMEKEDDFLEQSVMSYLHSLSGVSQAEVAMLLDGFVGRGPAWDQRILTWLSNVHEWRAPQAVALFEKVIASRIGHALSRGEKFTVGHIWSLQNLAGFDPAASCRILRCVLDGFLAVHRAHPRESRYPDLEPRLSEMLLLSLPDRLEQLNGSAMDQLLETLPQTVSETFLSAVLPWLEDALGPLEDEQEDAHFFRYHYHRDQLYELWYGSGRCVRHQIAEGVASALVQIAKQDIGAFHGYVARLASWKCLTPHQILVNAFQREPELLADEAVQYLLDDPRRLDLGDREGFDSRRLITLISPHLDEVRRDELQNFIVACSLDVQRWKGRQKQLLDCRGMDEMLLLEAFPPNCLNALARATARELRRKFPGLKASDSPSVFGWVRDRGGVPLEKALKISDRAWMRLFKREWQRPPSPIEARDQERRVRGLSGALINSIVAQPQRFHRLMQHLNEAGLSGSLSLNHRHAFIEGFAGATVPLEDRPKITANEEAKEGDEAPCFSSDLPSPTVAPTEWLFEAVRLFAPPPGIQGHTPDYNLRWSEARLGVARNLRQHEEALPDDLVALLESYVRALPHGDVDPEDFFEKERQRLATGSAHDSRNAVLNHERAFTLQVLMRVFDRAPSSNQERRWEMLEFVATDPSPLLRVAAIEELRFLLADHHEEATDLFERLVEGHPELMRAFDTREFLYHAMNGQGKRLLPHIEAMMGQVLEGADAAPPAAPSRTARPQVLIGEASWRDGVEWDKAKTRNRSQSDEECAQSGAELVAIAALSTRAVEDEARDDLARLLERCVTGLAPWRRGVAHVAVCNLETERAPLCLQWLRALLHDEDEKVRDLIGKFFSQAAKKISLPDEDVLRFADEFASAPALLCGLDEWRDYLWSLCEEEPDKTLSLLEKMLDNPHRAQSRLYYTQDWMRLALRLHTDSLNEPDCRARALGLFNRLTRENSGVAHQILTEWDRR